MMHMRGTPQTMTSKENTFYKAGHLASVAGAELQQRIDKAVHKGVEPWRIITDPGVSPGKALLIRNDSNIVSGILEQASVTSQEDFNTLLFAMYFRRRECFQKQLIPGQCHAKPQSPKTFL